MAKRCVGCMKMKENSPICEHCGYNENIPNYPHQLPIGTVLGGQYMVGKVLGQGGFGITYIGWDNTLDAAVAIKEFYPGSFVNRDCSHTLFVTCNGESAEHLFRHNRDRFVQEAKILAKLSHVPGIVRVHNLFTENNTAYIIMEYVEGIDLKRYLRMRGQTLSVEEMLHVMKPIMEALIQVHKAELVHRDISPDNIMVQNDGSIKLLDFGAAREVINAEVDKELPQSTEAIIKHGFAPIEQYRRRGSLGPWTDVYSLCATIYYCLAGKVPADAPERMIGEDNVDWKQVSGLTEQQRAALEQGMAMLPEKRIGSVKELYEALYNRTATEYSVSLSQTQCEPQPKPEPVITDYPVGTLPLEESIIEPIVSQSDASSPKIKETITSKVKKATAFAKEKYASLFGTPLPRTEEQTRTQNTTTSHTNTRNSVPDYPNYTIPLDVTPEVIGEPGTIPPKFRFLKKLTAIAAVVITIFAFAFLLSLRNPKSSTDKEPDWTTLNSIIEDGSDYTYSYKDGSYLELYFNDIEQECCRIYYNNTREIQYKFLAEYNEFGELQYHWSYDGYENLVKQDIYSFDRHGNVKSYVLTDGNGNVLEKTIYTYEKKDKLAKVVTTVADDTVKEELIYTYNSQGSKQTATQTYQNGKWEEMTFDHNENIVSHHYYNEAGKLDNWWEYEYDTGGICISSTHYNSEGNITIVRKPVYDENGNVIKEISYEADGSVYSRYTYHYIADHIRVGHNSSGGYIGYQKENINNILDVPVLDFCYYNDKSCITNSYDIFGNEIESISSDENGSYSSVSTYQYDIYGNLREEQSISTGELLFSSTRERYSSIETSLYDIYGNILERFSTTYYDDGSHIEVTYDQNDNYKRFTSYNADGTLNYDNFYEHELYDNGTKKKTFIYREDGTLKEEEYYNTDGKKTLTYSYNSNGDLWHWSKLIYDDNGDYLSTENHYE